MTIKAETLKSKLVPKLWVLIMSLNDDPVQFITVTTELQALLHFL